MTTKHCADVLHGVLKLKKAVMYVPVEENTCVR